MSPTTGYVRVDEHGVMRVGATRVMLDGVVTAWWDGDSPESIKKSYPAASLEQIYGAIAYYLGHRAEVDEYLKHQEQLWEELRRKQDEKPDPVIVRLRALRSEKASRATE